MQNTYMTGRSNFINSTDPNAQFKRHPSEKSRGSSTYEPRGRTDDVSGSPKYQSKHEDHLRFSKSQYDKPEDRGERSTFHPVTREWQRQKCQQLKLSCEKYISCGDMKTFYERTPPKKTLTVRGDGNCFFRAISTIITGAESEHMSVRTSVTKHVSDHPDMYRTFLMSRGGMKEYLVNMRRSSEWATDTEIMASATLLKTVIMVYFPCNIKGRHEYRWQTFKPLDNPDITYPVIYLTNKNEHFDPVVDVETE